MPHSFLGILGWSLRLMAAVNMVDTVVESMVDRFSVALTGTRVVYPRISHNIMLLVLLDFGFVSNFFLCKTCPF